MTEYVEYTVVMVFMSSILILQQINIKYDKEIRKQVGRNNNDSNDNYSINVKLFSNEI